MTCVIGFEQDGKVHMMSDSGIWAGNEWTQLREPKIREVHGAIIGIAGLYSWLQLFLDCPPAPIKGVPYVRTLARAWRDILVDDEDKGKEGADLLVGYEGVLSVVSSDGSSISSQRGIMGVGFCQYALGALETMMPEILAGTKGWDPATCLEECMDIQSLWTCTVMPPYTYAVCE